MKSEKSQEKRRYNISLSDFQLQKLEEKSKRSGMLRSQILLNYIDNGIKLEEAPVITTMSIQK